MVGRKHSHKGREFVENDHHSGLKMISNPEMVDKQHTVTATDCLLMLRTIQNITTYA
jgi:hypothetical protein